MGNANVIPGGKFTARAIMVEKNMALAEPSGVFLVRCLTKESGFKEERWREEFPNLVVNEGLAELLTNGLLSATNYVLLTGTAPSPAAGDTLASHVGWTEFTGYDEVTRPEWIEVQTGASADNVASVASFTITSSSQTIGGAGLARDNTKGGSSGILYCVAAFGGGDRTGNAAGDKIEVTYTATTLDDGV